jgi:hypothetical protein
MVVSESVEEYLKALWASEEREETNANREEWELVLVAGPMGIEPHGVNLYCLNPSFLSKG